MMRRYSLTHTDLEVSVLCFGLGSLGTGFHGAEADDLFMDFLDAGGNFVDTAHCYACWIENGVGASERELGHLLQRLGVRDRIIVATKGGHTAFGTEYPRPDAYMSENQVARDLEESLERLQLAQVDLYYLHRDDPRMPVGEIIEMLNRHVQNGRVRALGASNWSVARIAAANEYAAMRGLQGFVVSQVQWSLAEPNWKPGPDPTTRFVTREELVWHTASKLPIAAYSATASGYFAGSAGAQNPYDSPGSQARAARAQELAAQIGCTSTQVALAYLLNQPFPVSALFSTTQRAHLAEILGAARIALTPEQTRWLREG